MTDSTELAFASAVELRDLIRNKDVTPLELVHLYYERIDRLNPQLNAYLTLVYDQAVKAAELAGDAVMRGDGLGPLHGVPIGVKDLEMTAGIRTTSGSLVYESRIPDVDSIVVERIKNSGAIILGKTNTPELGLLGHTENRLGDHCRNPWDPSRTTGGSSGGAGSALAAGLCPLATGGDGGGSIRIPASYCGVFGIKPTQGRVPKYGGSTGQLMANQFSQQGPMSRTVKDSALLLQVLAGHDARDPDSAIEPSGDYIKALDIDLKGMRIGWSLDLGYAPVENEVKSIVKSALSSFELLGCVVEDVTISLEEPFDPFWTIFTANISAGFGKLLSTKTEDLAWYTKRCLDYGAGVTGAQYSASLGSVEKMKSQFREAFQHYDLILTPTMSDTAYPVGKPPSHINGTEAYWEIGVPAFTFPINMIGYPAASIPCGFDSKGLPVGLQMIGPPFSEETIIAASAAFERTNPWGDRKPPVC